MAGFLARASAITIFAAASLQAAASADLAEAIARLTRSTTWQRRDAILIRFKTHHPQGLVKIGDRFFMSSVEVTVRTQRYQTPRDGFDRDTGEGIGHLFQFDLKGNLIADLKLGEGAIYHPGGLDYDGEHLWVAAAEYRPNSRSIVYRVDPKTMTANEVFRFDDHLGALVHDTGTRSLHGISWGSRTFYRWNLSRNGRVTNLSQPERTPNPSHYVDYQDCKFAGHRRMACTGVTEFRVAPDAEPFRLGGIELISLRDHRPIHQVPLQLWTGGLDLTHNPVWLEAMASGLRGYFVPEDDQSTLYIYESR
jgi:hypothetical protein